MSPETPKKSFVGRLIRILLGILAIAVVLVALAPTLFSGFVKDKIVGAMEEQLDAQVEMADFSFGWMSGTRIEGFALTRPGSSEPALSIGSMSTNPSLSEIFSGRYIVEDIVVDDVVVRAQRTEAGVDWSTISKTKKKSGPQKSEGEIPDFLLRAKVNNLRVIYDDPKLSRPLDIAGMQVTFEAEKGKTCAIKIAGPYGLNCDLSCQVFDGDKLLDANAMTASGMLNVETLQLGDFAPSLEQFLASLDGQLKTNQLISYGPDGVIEIKGSSSWTGVVAKTPAAGLSIDSGTCENVITSEGPVKTAQAQLRLLGAEIVGLPKQIKGLPCGQGAIDVNFGGDSMLSFANGHFDIPGGSLLINGSHGLGETPGSGVNLQANTDLAMWSDYFDGIPDVRGKVSIKGSVPADMTAKPVAMNVEVDALRLTGGPLEDKAYDCGVTTMDLELQMPKIPDGPKLIRFNSKSRLWQVKSHSSLTQSATAAFGALGQSTLRGSLDLEQLMAPFADSKGQGRIQFDFLAKLDHDQLGIRNATVSGPQASAKLSADVALKNDTWNFLFDADRFNYNKSDGAGLVMSKLHTEGTWGKTSKALKGLFTMAGVRTIGGDGPVMNSGRLAVDFSGKADQERGDYLLNFDRMELAGFKGTGFVDYRAETGLGKIRIAGEADYGELSSRWIRLFDQTATGVGKGPLLVEFTPNGADWKAASGRLEMNIPGLKSHGFGITDLVVKGTMDQGIGKITEGQGKLNDGTLKLTGDVDLTGKEPKFNAAADMKRVRIVKEWQPAIARIIPLFAGIGVTAEGFISLDLKASGEGDSWQTINPRLSGDGLFGLTEGQIDGAPILEAFGLALGFNPDMAIKDINTNFKIRDGGIYQDGFVADFGTLQIKMAGTTYLDGRLDYDLGLKPVAREPANWQRFVSLLSTDGFLALKLTGTVDSPSPGLPDPGKLIEAGAKKLIGEGIGNLLGGKNKDGNKKKGIGGILEGLGGGNKNKKNDSNPINNLLNGLGGNKKKNTAPKKDGAKKKKKKGLGGLIDVLGGGNN